MDWKGIISSEPTEEEEMSSLVVGFSAQMCKRAAGLKGETTTKSDGKRLKRSSRDEEAQKDSTIILVDSSIKPPMIIRPWKAPLMRPVHL